MGSSESKIVVAAPVKAEPAVKNSRVTCLLDPRSPSANFSRTPIQIGGAGSRSSAMVENECHPAIVDPRSPTVGITRTPVREVMRAKVGSFARRLGMLFYHDAEYKAPQHFMSEAEKEAFRREELASTEPLLTPQSSQTFGSMALHANLLATPVQPPLHSLSDSSPFVLLGEAQAEVDIQTEADISLEEAEEAKESPLHKRLSMSLITCHEGAASSQIFAEVHHDCISPVPTVEVETFKGGVDHSYARPSITVEPESPAEPSSNTPQDEYPVQASSTQTAEALPSSDETENVVTETSSPPATAPPTEPGPALQGIRCPTFDPKSPSQVVFKPQWLGKDFGAAGLRVRGVQGQGGKGSSSPLALRVAVKTVTDENKRRSGKLKQKGTEGRSPLQILKETNSPRDQRSQLKLKPSTPNKQRLGHMDRVLAVALDKENR